MNEGGSSIISFQNNSNSQYDISIRENMYKKNTLDGFDWYDIYPIWENDYAAFKEVLDQLGDLSQLDIKHVSWIGSSFDKKEYVISLCEMD